MKKFSYMLVLAACISLAGCGSNQVEKQPETQTSQTSVETTVETPTITETPETIDTVVETTEDVQTTETVKDVSEGEGTVEEVWVPESGEIHLYNCNNPITDYTLYEPGTLLDARYDAIGQALVDSGIETLYKTESENSDGSMEYKFFAGGFLSRYYAEDGNSAFDYKTRHSYLPVSTTKVSYPSNVAVACNGKVVDIPTDKSDSNKSVFIDGREYCTYTLTSYLDWVCNFDIRHYDTARYQLNSVMIDDFDIKNASFTDILNKFGAPTGVSYKNTYAGDGMIYPDGSQVCYLQYVMPLDETASDIDKLAADNGYNYIVIDVVFASKQYKYGILKQDIESEYVDYADESDWDASYDQYLDKPVEMDDLVVNVFNMYTVRVVDPTIFDK